ncbi:MAG: J domain-containing protein [Spirochaetia bacterium]
MMNNNQNLYQTTENRIISKLLSGQPFSDNDIKRVFRELCKQTHPDLTGGDSAPFLKLQADYNDAIAFYQSKHKDELIKANVRKIDPKQIRVDFYESLRRYTAAGMHSNRIRLRQSLRDRNVSIAKGVLDTARFYDPAFIPVFLRYNKTYLQKFQSWQKSVKIRKGKWLFQTGFQWFLDYERNGAPGVLRTACSFLDDAIDILSQCAANEYHLATVGFAQWTREEIEKPAAGTSADQVRTWPS